MTRGWEDDKGGQVQEKMTICPLGTCVGRHALCYKAGRMTREDGFRRKWQLVLLAPALEDMCYDTRLGG